ncbi:MAG: hypothetical protein ACHQKY_12910 [Terriglobia bacterium]
MIVLVFGGILNSTPVAAVDPFEKDIGIFELHEQTFLDGLAKLNGMTDFGFSVELILKPSLSSPNPENPRFSGRIDNATLRQALIWLFQLDKRYTWTEDKDMINVFPKEKMEGGEGYFVNRRIPYIEYVNVKSWSDAVFFSVGQLPGRKEQIAIQLVGPKPDFPKPMTSHYTNISVREAFNVIARQCGKGWGWVLRGTALDFRLITFHQRLLPSQASK